MENQYEINRIAKKRVEDNERLNKYSNIREKINKIKDFKTITNDESTQNQTNKPDESFDIEQELKELQNLYDIQTKQTIETSKRGPARLFALKFRNIIQNEIRFTLDPIIEKQVLFNKKLVYLLSENKEQIDKLTSTSSEHKEIIDKLNTTSAKHQELMDQLSNTNSKHKEQIDKLTSTSSEHKEIIDKLNTASAKHQELMDQLSNTISDQQEFMDKLNTTTTKHQELMDQLSNTISDQQEFMDILNQKLDDIAQKSVVNRKIVSELNLLFKQNQELFTTLFHKKSITKPKAVKLKRSKKPKRTKRKRVKKVRMIRRKTRLRT